MFRSLLENFLNLIYKNKCIICNCSKTDNLLCKNCLKDVNFLSSYPHKIYNNTPIYSMAVYETTIKKLIQFLKFSHKKNSSIVLGRLLFEYFKKLKLDKNFIIVYPNSFYFKKLFRGYEHMYLIAKEFSKLSGLKVYKNIIKKTRNTIPQFKAKNRKLNIKDAFKINRKYINLLKEKEVLLIDDIITTGATLEEIIDILQKEGINNITCLTVSKAVKN